MSYATDALALIQALTALAPLPRVRALHLPPPPATEAMRGEFAALELEEGTLGLSYVLLGDTWAGLRHRVDRAALAGVDAPALAQCYASADPIERTLGFAALNALTRWLFDRAGFVPPVSRDSIGALDPQRDETVGMIGYFTPLIPLIRARGARVLVVELRADLVGERDGVRVTLDPAELSGCDKVLSTGTLLLNDTLDAMLAHCRGARRLALVGPSVGCPPDPLFARGITLLGGSWVTNGAAYVRALAAGASIGAFARKFTLAPQDYPGWDALLAQAVAGR
ncbi:Rossmann-like domain-containing protein [Azohydromonas caseinilytica]|uniref:DUF364 domain-containing protein n=1 Tax=Azohydromonas caseinilytica TaxID=2728836 RepID=A0A848FLC9_9BURK|nr:DUF364 domain-containing protein [Azohydromonas caseinilytica]NML19033.1 DUF364 domain-containing protein [Azohydromonas caseinilytica]